MRLALAALALSSSIAAAAAPAPDKALHALFEREFANGLEESPERATLLGIDGYDHRWTDLSPAAVARRKARITRVTAELKRFDPAKLSPQDRISREVYLTGLGLAAEENAIYGALPFGSDDSWLPVSTMDGPQFTVPYIVKSMRFRNARDYDNYLKRLEALPTLLSQTEARMRSGMKSGWVGPRAALPRVPAMLGAFAGADVTSTPLWQPLAAFPAEVAEADRRRITEAARRVLAEKVHPAFAALQKFYEQEYIPAATETLAVSKLPGGERYYALLARASTTTELTPAQIHEVGLSEVARIRGEMDRIIASTGFKGSFAEFIKFLNSDARFFFKTPEERLRAYRDIAKRADAALPPLFAELPRTPYGIRPMEAYEGDNADHYSQPALDGSRAGYFEANTNNLDNRPSHEMEATLLHEAVPGHHLQIARALELKDLPKFRRSGGYTAYVEGWALYAESLGYEMGFYTDPYNHFGALMAEMLRACRLVLDTGLHSKGWTREQAIRYFIDNGAGNDAFAVAEVDRYIVVPGQALGYKIGELQIKALRARARAALGERFDVRRFHNALLDDGALPLTVLDARIAQWIATERATRK
ncbi:MAG TPA: DUF885 domain-containing protein [Usitatibacter sp.]|nr:DUF885 domain-containing protein [Usitatibacter sp.]